MLQTRVSQPYLRDFHAVNGYLPPLGALRAFAGDERDWALQSPRRSFTPLLPKVSSIITTAARASTVLPRCRRHGSVHGNGVVWALPVAYSCALLFLFRLNRLIRRVAEYGSGRWHATT
jgi:hypothetical protein